MITAHKLVLRHLDPDAGDAIVTGPFDRIDGGWHNPATAEWYSDSQVLKAKMVSTDGPAAPAAKGLRCKECGELTANEQGLSSHMRHRHGAKKP